MKKNLRKGFTLVELIFVIIIIGILTISITNYSVGQSDKIEISSLTGQINRDIVMALSDYKKNYYLSNGIYQGAHADTIFMYLPNSSDYILTGAGASSKIHHKDLTGYYFQIAPDSFAGNSDSKYKIFFNGSELKTSKAWSPEQATRIESELASFYKKAFSTNAKIGGQSVLVGADNLNVVSTAIDTDLMIAIGGCGK